MIARGTMCRAAISILVMLSCTRPSEALASAAVPVDFTLTAEYGPPARLGSGPSAPMAQWNGWGLTITADGKAVQETYSREGKTSRAPRREFRLTRQQVARFVQLIDDSNFFLLSDEYTPDASDAETLRIRVTLNRRLHQVTVNAPAFVAEREELTAFFRIWNEVLRAVPPPNAGQVPSDMKSDIK